MVVSESRNPNLTKERWSRSLTHELGARFGDNWWTGLPPSMCKGFNKQEQTLHALPFLNLSICSRQDIIDYFNNSWALTELLFAGLKVEEAFMRPPYHALRHPMIFYYGHPAVLYVNKLRLAGLLSESVNLYLEKVLETGVDEMSWDDMSKNEMEWPSVAEVHAYRKKVYDLVLNLLRTHPDLEKNGMEFFGQHSPWWALFMGFEHEKIHFETSSVLIRELPIEFVQTPKHLAPMGASSANFDSSKNEWVGAKAQRIELGKNPQEPSFGWDNEYGSRSVQVCDFEYTKFQISNAEFFEFVKCGAYVNDAYWRTEGREWRKFRNTKRPTFWVSVGPEGGHEYELRTIFEIVKMPWNWPVEVNFHEAVAYCNWIQERLGKEGLIGAQKREHPIRLLTEAEFSLLRSAASDVVLQTAAFKNSDHHLPFSQNFNFKHSSPCDVGDEIAGNVWHWVEDQFNPLSNFKIHKLYDDFSTPCFDGKHQMIMGGSFMSCGNEASKFARFHFRPHFYQHSGFRMARSVGENAFSNAALLNTSNDYVHVRRDNVLAQMNTSDTWWQDVNQPLDFTEAETQKMLEQTQIAVMEFVRKYSTMHPAGTAHDAPTGGLKENFSAPYQTSKNFPHGPSEFGGLLKFVLHDMAALGQLPGHPGYAAYVAGAGNFVSNVAQLVAQTVNPYTAHASMAPGFVAMEHEVLKWFMNMVGYDTALSRGSLTTGASTATLHAIIIARQAKVNSFNYTRITGYVSDSGHHCVVKAWALGGMNPENLRVIKSTHQKMNCDALEAAIQEDLRSGFLPIFAVGTAGTTKTGSVDNLERMASICEKNNLWFHVDGAYGAFFMLTQKGRTMLKGLNQANSIALDPHKSLSLPYGTGCLLVRDGKFMEISYAAEESYMPPQGNGSHLDFANITPELSRDFRGLRVWLPIKTLGIEPFVLNLEEKLRLADWFASELQKLSEIVIVSAPELSIFAFAHKRGNNFTRQLLTLINSRGTLFLSSCDLDGCFSIRVCLLGFRLHYSRLRLALSEIESHLKALDSHF